MHFVLRGVKQCGPRRFPRRWTCGTPRSGLPRQVRFSRRAVYYGFERLKQLGVLRQVAGNVVTYELADCNAASSAMGQLWANVVPVRPAQGGQTEHARLTSALRRAGQGYEGLPPPLKLEFAGSIADRHPTKGPLDSSIVLHTWFKELMPLDEAQELDAKVRTLLRQHRFTSSEKRAKEVPLTSRPGNWRRPGWKPPPLVKNAGTEEEECKPEVHDRELSLAERVMEGAACAECHVMMVYDRWQGRWFCPRCGIEAHLDSDSQVK